MPMELSTLGERLFWARRSYARLTQQQLRDRMQEDYGVDIGRNYISQLETEAGSQPTFAVVRAMAGVMKISLDYLAGFTDNFLPANGEDAPPHYFSPEADEVAQLVDALPPELRNVLVNVARNIAVAPSQRLRERAEARDLLDSVERQFGRDVRLQLEDTVRKKGLPLHHRP